MEDIDDLLLYQRVRNGTIEYVEILSSLERVAAWGTEETWHHLESSLEPGFDLAPLVYSPDEKRVMAELYRLVDDACALTEDTWDLEYLTSNAEWKMVAAKAKAALGVFEKRGRFSDEIVETEKY